MTCVCEHIHLNPTMVLPNQTRLASLFCKIATETFSLHRHHRFGYVCCCARRRPYSFYRGIDSYVAGYSDPLGVNLVPWG